MAWLTPKLCDKYEVFCLRIRRVLHGSRQCPTLWSACLFGELGLQIELGIMQGRVDVRTAALPSSTDLQFLHGWELQRTCPTGQMILTNTEVAPEITSPVMKAWMHLQDVSRQTESTNLRQDGFAFSFTPTASSGASLMLLMTYRPLRRLWARNP